MIGYNPHGQNTPKIRNQRSILLNFQLKYTCYSQEFQKNLNRLKKRFFAQNGKKGHYNSVFHQNISRKLVFSSN